jgi:DNA repair protein RecN (Recombination protein N)
MLEELQLRNYTIIDDLSLVFHPGFCVITGETGAGKSILIEALSLLLGGRSDADVLRYGADEAVLEARFDTPSSLSAEADACEEESLILKRVFSPSKGRAYINGSLANLSRLKEVGRMLAEIHGQHDHHLLTRPDHQLVLLDAYTQSLDQRQCVAAHYQKRAEQMKELTRLKNDSDGGGIELFRHQLDEIQTAHVQLGEDVLLEQEERTLKNWETILSLTQEGYDLLSDFDAGGILIRLQEVEQRVKTLHQITEDAAGEIDLLQNAKIQLKELSLLFRDRLGRLLYDPDRLNQVTERLYQLQKLKKKYGGSLQAVIDLQTQLALRLVDLSGREERLAAMEQEIQSTNALLMNAATVLSKARQGGRNRFIKKVKEELSELGMEKTRFDIRWDEKPVSEEGIDAIEFLIALPGEPFQSIEAVASGGELARLMLALKVSLSEVDPIPTMVFDEVDAGIGGAVAEQVGRRLSRLSQRHQVFCITHLAQVARFANHHYRVEKKEVGKRMVTSVKKLTHKERIVELARMLGGMNMTDTTYRHAEELLKNTAREHDD